MKKPLPPKTPPPRPPGARWERSPSQRGGPRPRRPGGPPFFKRGLVPRPEGLGHRGGPGPFWPQVTPGRPPGERRRGPPAKTRAPGPRRPGGPLFPPDARAPTLTGPQGPGKGRPLHRGLKTKRRGHRRRTPEPLQEDPSQKGTSLFFEEVSDAKNQRPGVFFAISGFETANFGARVTPFPPKLDNQRGQGLGNHRLLNDRTLNHASYKSPCPHFGGGPPRDRL